MLNKRFLPIIAATAAPVCVHAATGTFLDRELGSDIRVATYNVYSDSIFADTNPARATRFARMLNAVDADVWCFQEIYTHTAAQVQTLLNTQRPLSSGSWQIYKSGEHVIASKYALSMGATNTNPVGFRPVAMALVNLPDATYPRDLYLMNAHYKCCNGFDPDRQKQSDAFVNWMRDARTVGGNITITSGTPMITLGDFNIVDGIQPVTTLLDGNIIDNATYGVDSATDWDGSNSTDTAPTHNAAGVENYTWRNDHEPFAPARLDYIVYTDSVIAAPHKFALNTYSMNANELAATGLQPFDSLVDTDGMNYDHLPVIVDFRQSSAKTLIWNGASGVWNQSLGNWQNAAVYANGDVARFNGDSLGTVQIDVAGVSPGAVIVNNGTGNYSFTGGSINGSTGLTKSGTGVLSLHSSNSYTGGTTVSGGELIVGHANAIGSGSLAITAAARVTLSTGLPQAVRVTALAITNGGSLDLQNNQLIVAGGSLSGIAALIQQGYNNGGWTGTGITSSSAVASPAIMGIGYAGASQLGYNSFAGRNVFAGDVLLMSTFLGDANLDGRVNTSDFNRLAGQFGAISGKSWIDGDFNYDGAVNSTDFTFLAGTYGSVLSQPLAAAVVPEPAMFSLLTLFLTPRRRWRNGR